MRATFSGIEIGRTGLNISQLGLDVTGHNIANVETDGYTRQRIVQTAYDPFGTIGRALPVAQALVGGGVRVQILDQIRSAYLDRRFRTENTTNAYWLKRTESLTYLESYFDNAREETSINFSIGKLFEAIKVLAEDPVEGAPRKLLQTAGKDLAQQLNNIYAGLIDLQETQNLAVKVTVEDINRIANEIVELNKSIYGFEITGHLANDLRDKRNLLLDELAALIDIEYKEEADGFGGVRLSVEIGGKTLVEHDRSYKLDVGTKPNPILSEDNEVWVPIWAPDPYTEPKLIDGKYVAYFNGLDGTRRTLQFTDEVDAEDLGAVQKAIAEINSIAERFAQITPEWADMDVTDPDNIIWPSDGDGPEAEALFNRLQELLVDDVEIFAMNPDSNDHWDWCVHTGISIGDADYVYACSNDLNKISTHAAIRLESDIKFRDSVPLEVKGGELRAYLDMRDSLDSKTPGIPYYINMLNDLARALVHQINEVHSTGWTDSTDGSLIGVDFFSGKVMVGGVETFLEGHWEEVLVPGVALDLTDPDLDPFAVDGSGNRLYRYVIDLSRINAKNICLSDLVDKSEFNIACSTKEIVKHGTPEELQRGNNENMNTLYELFLKKDISISYRIGTDEITKDIGSFDGFATSIRFDLANTLNFAKKTTINSTVLLLAAENQRVSVSGVSLDEEMINMVKYQHAYSGASRVITAMDEMLDKLINSTGRVGL